MATSQITAALSVHPFLDGFPPKYMDKISQLAVEAAFEPDQIVFREGDPSSFFYLIVEGRVALEICTPNRILSIQTVEGGEELGWSSLLSRVDKQFRARCLDPVRAIAFDGARVIAACEEDHEFGYLIMRKVLEIVAERLRATRMQMLDVYSSKGAHGK